MEDELLFSLSNAEARFLRASINFNVTMILVSSSSTSKRIVRGLTDLDRTIARLGAFRMSPDMVIGLCGVRGGEVGVSIMTSVRVR